jgi:hypothetical protein
MEIRIGIDEDSLGRDLLSLRRWLRREKGLYWPDEAAATVPPEGRMGSATDVLVVAVGSGGAISALATSLGVWLTQLKSRPRPAVTVTITMPDGTAISVQANQADDPASVVREALSAAFRRQSPPSRKGKEG